MEALRDWIVLGLLCVAWVAGYVAIYKHLNADSADNDTEISKLNRQLRDAFGDADTSRELDWPSDKSIR